MRKKVWLSRDYFDQYCLTLFKPNFYEVDNRGLIINDLCPKFVEKWFGLKRSLKRDEHVQGYFNVSFKPIRRKK